MDAAAAWQRLSTVLDPEVPVLSIVDLGIVRDVVAGKDGIVVTITPTYAGCPAMEAITADIRSALEDGAATVTIVTTLAPAWTTDWVAPEARERLRAYGIAPPHARVAPGYGGRTIAAGSAGAAINVAGISPLRRQLEPVACPRCASVDTRLVSQFGSTACKALYRCASCSEPFDYMKPH